MKRKCFLLFVMLFPCVLFSQPYFSEKEMMGNLKKGYTEGHSGNTLFFYNGEFVFSSEYYLNDLFKSSMQIEEQNGLCFLLFPEADKRLLCLVDDTVCLLYDGITDKPFFMGYWSLNGLELIHYYKDSAFTATSELKEGAITYSAGNLASFDLKTPWVEGTPGNGEGEAVFFRLSDKYLFLFSGYISYDKPYLYEQNSRPKKIRITLVDDPSRPEFIFNLEDTPNPQKLEFPERMYGNARLEILEVYPGSKYEDTCIHAILGKCF